MTRPTFLLMTAAILVGCSAPDSASTQDAASTEVTEAQSQDVQTDAPALAGEPTRQVPVLTQSWVLDGFGAPESVIPTASGEGYYVSMVGGEGRAEDNNGAIAIIGTDGTLVERRWVTGTDALPLHAPKGMTLMGDRLLVTDIDHLVLIDVTQGAVVARIPAAEAGFLNDVASGPNGTAFISDSANARIYKLEDDAITVWMEEDRLGGVNGLHMQDGQLLVTTMSGGELLSIDPDTKAVTGLATGMENADSIGVRADGSYMISSWPGQLWHVRAGEAPTLLQDTSGEEGAILMNDVLFLEDAVIAPNWMPGTVRAYRLD